MFKHILVATDGSELSAKAVAAGIALAKEFKAELTAVTVSEPWTALVPGAPALGFPNDDYLRGAAENAELVLGRVREAARAAGVHCTFMHAPDQFPADGIVECAKRKGCDLIVMASHGRRGPSRWLLGSETTRVITHASVPVLVYR